MIITLDEHRRELGNRRTGPRIRARAERQLRECFWHGKPYTKVIIMVGLPGAGKSTWAQAHDDDHTVIYDTCNSTVSARARIKLQAGAPRTEMVWIDTPVTECLIRNEDRLKANRVPEHIIRWMARTMEPPGFHEAHKVTRVPGFSH